MIPAREYTAIVTVHTDPPYTVTRTVRGNDESQAMWLAWHSAQREAGYPEVEIEVRLDPPARSWVGSLPPERRMPGDVL